MVKRFDTKYNWNYRGRAKRESGKNIIVGKNRVRKKKNLLKKGKP